MKALKDLTLIGIGICIALLIPDIKKENLKEENQKLYSYITYLKEEKTKPAYEGGLTILPTGTKSLTFTGFNGTIRWYQSSNFENLVTNNPTDFQPLGGLILIQGEPRTIPVPENAKAIFRKTSIDGSGYKMEIQSFF